MPSIFRDYHYIIKREAEYNQSTEIINSTVATVVQTVMDSVKPVTENILSTSTLPDNIPQTLKPFMESIKPTAETVATTIKPIIQTILIPVPINYSLPFSTLGTSTTVTTTTTTTTTPSTTTLATTTAESTLHRLEEKFEKATHLPAWGVFFVLLVVMGFIASSIYCCFKRWWKKFRDSDKAKGFRGIDLKSVNLIGQIGKEKVQPDTQELTQNMEENEIEQDTKAAEKRDLKLGRLQYKLDYDFNSSNVR